MGIGIGLSWWRRCSADVVTKMRGGLLGASWRQALALVAGELTPDEASVVVKEVGAYFRWGRSRLLEALEHRWYTSLGNAVPDYGIYDDLAYVVRTRSPRLAPDTSPTTRWRVSGWKVRRWHGR